MNETENQQDAPVAEDPTIEESVQALMEELPAPVRDFIESPARFELARDITAKYQLHIDQAGVFEQEMILMLLGAKTPEEFAASLASDANLPPETISAITNEVNQKVFMPIQQRMRSASEVSPADVPSRSTQQPAAPAAAAPVAPIPVAPISISPLQRYEPPTNLPGAEAAVAPAPVLQPAPIVPPPAPRPIMRTMQSDFPIVGTLSRTAPAPAAPPLASMPTPAAPQAQPAPRPIQPQPAAAPSAARRAPMIDHALAPDPTRPWIKPPSLAAVPAPARPAPETRPTSSSGPPTKSYGDDPYREPIE